MKKLASILASLLLVAFMAGCGGNGAEGGQAAGTDQPAGQEQPQTQPEPQAEGPAETGGYADGVYYAESDEFSNGWKEIVALKVEGGKIVDVEWNALPENGGLDKKNYDKAGKYGMKDKGGAQADWWEQAEKAEAYLIEVQDPDAIPYNPEDGRTDAIAGVSIHVNGLAELAKKALAAGPVEPGPYKDGTYYAEEDEFGSSGWKNTVTITVLNGRIIAVDWNGVNKDGVDKDTYSASGEYGMVAKGGAQAEWHEQAARAEAYLIQTQDPTAITYTDEEGHTDAIAGVSIHVSEFFKLAEKALEGAK
ncbi:MAG: FMN-binding protein [Paenibacillaceae bacterium ZCTH02-B3]|nr:MAG: FMN-binding protein [Paenibacillaceae bacterium ZCTH02-B3]